MPQGKGTYGRQVGRPSKKNKYQEGGSVDPFSSKNPEGIIAEKAMEAIDEMNLPEGMQGNMQDAIPTSNAMDRSESYQLGGAVQPPTSPSIQPPTEPGLQPPVPGGYKEGGKVGSPKKEYTVKTKTAGFDKAEKEHKAREKAEKGMTFDQKIAAAKARKAKTDTTKSKSAYQLAKEAAARQKARLAKKGKK